MSRHLLVRLLIAAGALFVVPVWPEDVASPAPEAPTTIFSTQLGGADVSLDLLGSWTAAASFGTGLLLAPGLPPQPLDAFPQLDQGFIFSQTPDLTISLELLKRFFIDATVLGDFQDNAIHLGYRGAPGEVLQLVRVGTADITMEPSPLLSFPAQAAGSLGAQARFASGSSTNDLLLRWDVTQSKHKVFIGMNELVEQHVPLDSYARGRYFFLPDTGLDPNTLQVFLEDPQGTYVSALATDGGRTYRLAGFDDVVLDSTLGLVSLRNPVKGRVLVHYRKSGYEVGDPAIGKGGLPGTAGPAPGVRDPATATDFHWGVTDYLSTGQKMSDRRVDLSGAAVGQCLLLWEPGDSSPFEIDNSYAFADQPPNDVSRISYRLAPLDASAVPPSNLIFQSLPAEQRFQVLASRDPRGTYANFFPFSDPDGLLYGPKRDSLAGTLHFEIFVQELNPVSDLVLEQNVVPGSVQLTVNGVSESRFDLDPASGKLTMRAPIQPTDRIEASYRTTEQGTTGGDLLLAWQDRIPFSDAFALSLSAGIRWNADPWSYTQQPYAKSGTILAAVGVDGKSDHLSYSAQAGVAYTNPDTTGVLRLFGMEGHAVVPDLSEEAAYPASVPVPVVPSVFAPAAPPPSRTNRGELYYRDYRVYGALGSSQLQPISSSFTPTLMPYADGFRMGPYNVLGSADASGNANVSTDSLVFEYALGSGQWVGAQSPISAGSDVDLSGARALTIRLRSTESSGTASVYLQLGSISEDLVGDGKLRAEASSAEAGFPFIDAAHGGITLRVGAGPKLTGNGVLDSEDRNANGVLDLEDPSRIVTHPVSFPGQDWTTITFALTDDDRQKLLQTRSVRIIIQEATGSAPAHGTIVVDTLSVEASPFWPQTAASADRPKVVVDEVSETLARSDPGPGKRLEDAYPNILKLFHGTGSLPQQVLETSWSGISQAFSIRGFAAQGTGGIHYNTVVSFLRSATPGVTYQFALLDAAGRGIHWSLDSSAFADGGWHEVQVSQATNSVQVDGKSPAAGATEAAADAGFGELSIFQIDVTGAGGGPPPSSGLLYIDEVYLTDPQGSFGAAFVGTLSLSYPGALLSLGSVPMFANLDLRQDVSMQTAGFAPLYGEPSSVDQVVSRTQIAADILLTRIAVDLRLLESAGTLEAAGGHKITLPAGGSPFSLIDSFYLTEAGGFSRENDLEAGTGWPVSASVRSKSSVDDLTGVLQQEWSAGAAVNLIATVAADLELSQAISGYPLPILPYGDRWVRELSLLAPYEGGADLRRAGKLGFKAALPANPFGFSVEAETAASGSDYSPQGFTQESDALLAVLLSLRLGEGTPDDMTFSLSYRRALSLSTAPLAGPRFAAEGEELFRALSLQSYLWGAIPVQEIFVDNTETVSPAWLTATQGSYTPSLDLSLQRSYGSRLVDLVIPSSINLSLRQDLQRQADLIAATVTIEPKVSTHAINLFGRLGAYPMVPWMDTDEYSLGLSGSIQGPPLQSLVLTTLSADGYLMVKAQNGAELTLVESLKRDQTAAVSVSSDTQVLLDWTYAPPGGIPVPLVPAEVSSTVTLASQEKVEITVAHNDASTFHPFTLTMGHATSLVFPGHGTIKASVDVGADVEDLLQSGLVWRLAVRAALEAKLTF